VQVTRLTLLMPAISCAAQQANALRVQVLEV
jgi:hypothetical protein